MGDFNINTLNPRSPILQVISNYVQVGSESTQIAGALLEDVFVRKDVFKKIDIKNIVKTSHFSDHGDVLPTLLKTNASNIQNVTPVKLSLATSVLKIQFVVIVGSSLNCPLLELGVILNY